MPRLSILIPAYNCLPDVLRCLTSALATTDPVITEVLIQDDASTEYDGPTVFGADRCARNAHNLGFAANCNAAAGRAAGEVLLFLNQDCWAERPGWDRALLDHFAAHPRCGIAGPTLLLPGGRVQSVGGAFDAASQPFHPHLGAANPDWQPINTARPVAWITGAALAIRRDLWDALEGFDAEYARGYFEDVDLCVRAGLLGCETWHVPAVRLYHAVGSTGGSATFRANALRFKRRWVDSGVIEPGTHAPRARFWV